MATLNTLRTKFGVVLSAVIAFALLAFIFSLKSEMGFSGNDPVVATINGEDITYTKYQTQYEEISSQNNVDESNEQQVTAVANATMQALVTEYVLTPGFNDMGIAVSDQERMSIISGAIPTQAFYSAFADPATGAYDIVGVNQFLTQAGGNPEAEAAWSFINKQARKEREASKYISLLSSGAYANNLEVKTALAQSNKSFNGRWASKQYSDLADSLYRVSNSEIAKYYESNKEKFRQSPSRTITYVNFDVIATADDRMAIEADMKKVGEEFASAENIRGYVRDNRYGSVASNFVAPTQLLSEESAAFETGEMYGPVLSNDTWRVSRALRSLEAPDSVGIRIIALPYTSTDLADSLVTVLKGGAEFAEIAAQYSMHQQSAQMGGDMGVVPFSAFNVEMADALYNANNGDIVSIEVGDAIQIIEAYNVGKKSIHYMVASIEQPVVASQATINKAHADAGLFAVDAKGSADKFEASANNNGKSSRVATIARGERSFRNIESSREVARWAFGAEVGDLSEIFKVEDGYVVAMLSDIDDNNYQSLEAATSSIKNLLVNDKKFEAMKSELKGGSFDEMSESLSQSGTFEDIDFASYYIPNVGVEPRVAGAITSSTEANVVSAPIKGSRGLYIIEVTEIVEAEEPTTIEAEKVRLTTYSESVIQQMAYPALERMSNVEDLRGKFF